MTVAMRRAACVGVLVLGLARDAGAQAFYARAGIGPSSGLGVGVGLAGSRVEAGADLLVLEDEGFLGGTATLLLTRPEHFVRPYVSASLAARVAFESDSWATFGLGAGAWGRLTGWLAGFGEVRWVQPFSSGEGRESHVGAIVGLRFGRTRPRAPRAP